MSHIFPFDDVIDVSQMGTKHTKSSEYYTNERILRDNFLWFTMASLFRYVDYYEGYMYLMVKLIVTVKITLHSSSVISPNEQTSFSL